VAKPLTPGLTLISPILVRNVVMCPRQNFDLGSHLWVWSIFPKNPNFFNFFRFGSKKSHRVGSKNTQVKDGLASYLLQVKSMLKSGQGPSSESRDSPYYDCTLKTEPPSSQPIVITIKLSVFNIKAQTKID